MRTRSRSRSASLIAASVAVVGGITAGWADPVGVAHAATAPPGFEDALVGSFSGPTAVEWLPDSRIVVLEQRGRLRIGTPDGTFVTAHTFSDICSNGERGLLGFTHDPAFLSNGYVYVYFTHTAPDAPGGCVSRVSRLTLLGNTIDRASEVVLLDNISSVNTNHNGGDLDIGSDGYLYVSVGDAGRDPRGDSGSAGGNDAAQDLSLLNGKILRITLDGRPAPGNPIAGGDSTTCATRGNTPSTPTTPCQEIFAWGLRNPYRFAFDRNDGSNRFFINDVGQGTREEVDLGVNGANYGWPIREGKCAQGANPPCAPNTGGFVDPLVDYGRDIGQFVTAGAFVPNGVWPAGYDGAYLFGDGGSGRVWLRAADGSVDFATPFLQDAGGITDMTFGYDTDGRAVLYYTQAGGSVRKITPTAPAPAPPAGRMALTPLSSPLRAYDSDGVGVAAGDVFNGSTRMIDLDLPAGGAQAALVNITLGNTRGAGFVRAWTARGQRPPTSNVNVDQSNAVAANAAIVPLDADGRFVIEAATTGRVIVDVMGYFTIGASSRSGRFVALDPARVLDTRQPAGNVNSPGATNAFTRIGDRIRLFPFGPGGAPAGEPAGAVALSIGAVGAPAAGGFVGAFPTDVGYQGTSNVNTTAGDVRANIVVVPVSADGSVSLATLNIDDVVVDLVGYFTSAAASDGISGMFSFVAPTRLVDTRRNVPFGRLSPLVPVTTPTGTAGAAIVQNVTVAATSQPGWLATFPAGTSATDISNVNFTGAGQARAVLAFTKQSGGAVSYEALVGTDLVVDLVGSFAT